MQQLKRNRQLAIFLLLCSFFFSACQGFTGGVLKKEKCIKPDEIGKLLLTLKNKNLDLKTFKGVGKVTLYRDGKKNPSNRIAWIGASPNRLRAVLSSASGQPFLSFSCDGRWFYFFDHLQRIFYKRRTNRYVMQKVFSVSIELDDIINILSGRIPMHQYRSACLLKDNFSQQRSPTLFQHLSSKEARGKEGKNILVLKGILGNIYEKIYLDDNKKDARKIEVFGLDGALEYRVELSRLQNVNGYRIPAAVVVSNAEGSGFQLDVEKYWPHAHIEPSIFVLLPPKP